MSAEAPDSLLLHETEVFNNTADIDGGGVLLVSVTNGTANFVRSPIKQNSVRLYVWCGCQGAHMAHARDMVVSLRVFSGPSTSLAAAGALHRLPLAGA
jgi:hypothetical protein